MTERPLHPDTLAIHGGGERDAGNGATVAPIWQTSAFAYGTAEELEAVFAGREAGHVYTRISNPTLTAFEKRLTVLEGGLGTLACASGMAAITCATLALCGEGDRIVCGSSVFGGTYSLFDRTLRRCGIETVFVPSTDPEAFAAAVTDRTRLFFVESLGNPRLDVPDIAALGAVARRFGVILAVDNTAVTPMLFQPGRHGAHLVVHSTSKYINGHGTAIGGAVVDCGTYDWGHPRAERVADYYKRARQFAFLAALPSQIHRDLGGCLSPFNAFLMGVGLDSLGVRMERHCANALHVATTLAAHPAVVDVRYPGLAAHPQQAVARHQFGDRFGGLVCIRLGDKDRCFRFLNALRRAQILANLGDAKTLAIHPASTFCREATAPQREAMGVTEDLVRLAIGIEHADDILEDLTQSLDRL